MKNVIILGAQVVFNGDINNSDLEEGFGAIRLNCDGREYILDVVYSTWASELDETTVALDLEVDKETFEDCKYDLTENDLQSNNLISTIFIGEVHDILKSATLFVKIGGENGMTKAIDLILE